MASINVRRDVTDQFYRYKMERIQSKIEGKGNGIKTVIVNLTSVARDLAREPGHIIKYFGFELGAQTNTNPADDRWIINGAHEASKLQDHLDGFITKFVLCKKCKNPETDPSFPDGLIVLQCKACGAASDVDPRLKLSSFILKTIPKKGKKKDKANKKPEKKARSKRGINGNDTGSNDGQPNDSQSDHAEVNGEDDDEEITRLITSGVNQLSTAEENKEVEWALDTSEAAVKARAMGVPDRSLVLNGGGEEEQGGIKEGEKKKGGKKYDKLGSWILKEAKEKGGIDDVDGVKLYLKAVSLDIDHRSKTLEVIALTIFDESIVKQIEERSGMLKKLIAEPESRHEKISDLKERRKKMRTAEDRRQMALLTGTEALIQDKPELIPQVYKIMDAYYEHALVTEEVFQAWGAKAEETKDEENKANEKFDLLTSVGFRTFLKWLDEAEEDDDANESDSDDE